MRRFLCCLLLASLIPSAHAAQDGDKARLMARMRAEAATLTEEAQRLETLAGAHESDAPAPAPESRLRLRRDAAEHAKALRRGIEDFWTLDDADRAARGGALLAEIVKKGETAGDESVGALAEVAMHAKFPGEMWTVHNRARAALEREAAAFDAAAERRAASLRLKLGFSVIVGGLVLAAGLTAYVMSGGRPKSKTG